MIDFIPIESYTPIYYHIMLLVVILTFLHTQTSSGGIQSLSSLKNPGFAVFWFVLLYMGLRPIHGIFVDMTVYARIFDRYQSGFYQVDKEYDLLFHYFTYYSAKYVTVEIYFLLCAALYVVPLYLVSKKWFREHWFYSFLFLVVSFSFWAYGTNGIRNGIAGSLFLLAISKEKRLFQVLWLFLAINFHQSMMLPALGFVVAQFLKNPRYIIGLWLLCIPFSLVAPGFWESFFGNLGFDDERLGYLTDDTYADAFSSSGFRWDFLLYSSVAVFAGWYYIVKKGFNDKIYYWLYITYTFANAFWILVIRASFSNRFAYLSWFMMALVIVYPLLKEDIISNQRKKIGWILVSYFAFTYLMGIILK